MKNIDLRNYTVSEGTLRTEDLIEAFEDFLNSLNIPFEKEPHDEYYLEHLDDQLNELAPEGYYFGAHPGDGACLGFWSIENY